MVRICVSDTFLTFFWRDCSREAVGAVLLIYLFNKNVKLDGNIRHHPD